jgi:hypothetical protein
VRRALIFILLFFAIPASANEKISPGEFIKYSEEVFDALDKVDTIFLNYESTGLEAKLAIKNLDVALKKYERLGEGAWADKEPQAIRVNILNARLSYDIYLMTGNKGNWDEAIKFSDKARSDFRRYKQKHKK